MIGSHPARKLRFLQEAKTASALNHPHMSPFTTLIAPTASITSRWN